MLPVEEIETHSIAQQLLNAPALQWRLQLSQIFADAGAVEGTVRI